METVYYFDTENSFDMARYRWLLRMFGTRATVKRRGKTFNYRKIL